MGKDNKTVSYQTHEMKTMATKTDLLHWSTVAVIKRKLGTNDPNYLQEYIADLKGNKKDLVITYAEMFGEGVEGEG